MVGGQAREAKSWGSRGRGAQRRPPRLARTREQVTGRLRSTPRPALGPPQSSLNSQNTLSSFPNDSGITNLGRTSEGPL